MERLLFIAYIDGVIESHTEASTNGDVSYDDMIMPLSLDDDLSTPILYRAANGNDGTEFGQYITSAKVQKIENGEWKDATEFQNDDNVRVELRYTLPDGVVIPNNKTIWYQLPDGVYPNENLSGNVYDKAGNAIGVYSIATDGMINITFNDEYATGREITGDIFFTGRVESDNTSEDKKIEFGGSGTSIVIKKEDQEETKTDISIKKEGRLISEDQINYTVTISSKLGTGEAVELKDYLTNGTYNENSIKVTDKDGKVLSSDQYHVSVDNSSNKRTMTITGLPELKANESYTVTYSAKPGTRTASGEVKVDNSATTNKGKSDWNSIIVKKNLVSKSGKYDSNTNTITWTVEINPQGTDLKGYTIKDVIGGVELSNYDAVLKYSDGTEKNIKLPYTFEESTTQALTYTITYKTDVSNSSSSGNIKNGVTIDKNGDKYSADTSVGYERRNWDLNKYKEKDEISGNSILYTWNSTITLPDKKLSELETFTYQDTISGECKHIAKKSDIDTYIKNNIEFKYIDENGNDQTTKNLSEYFDYNVTYTPDDTDEITAFAIEFKPKQNLTVKGKQIQFKYQTVADISTVESGKTVKFYNTARVGEKEKTVTVEYTKPVKLRKTSSANGAIAPPTNLWDERGSSYTTEYTQSQSAVRLDENGYLYYRLLLNTDNTSPITISDMLPIGTGYVENSAFAAYCKVDKNGTVEVVRYTIKPIGVSVTPEPKTTSDGENYQQLTIKLSNIDKSELNSYNGYIGVYYAVKVDSSILEGTGTLSLTNKAEWDKEYAEATTNVKKIQKIVEKTGEQAKDENGVVMDSIKYKVVINPGADDLAIGKDTLTLTDTISYNKLKSMTLNLDTVRLYYYDSEKQDNCGDEVSDSRYQIRYNSDNGKMTVIVPDALACVLVYQYNYDKGSLANLDEVTVSNSVKLVGETSKSEITKLKVNDSGATAHQKIHVYKVDSSDFTKKLAGAEFKLERWGTLPGEWRSHWIEVSTYTSGDGSNSTELGEFILNPDTHDEKKDGTIWQNTFYRLTETKAPEGYTLSSEPYYFVLTDNAKASDISGYWNWPSERDNMHMISLSGANIYIQNVANQLSVRKVWVDQDNREISGADGSIQVQLYKSTGKLNGVNVEIKWNPNSKNILVEKGTEVVLYTGYSYAEASCSDSSVKVSKKTDNVYIFTGISTDCTITIKNANGELTYYGPPSEPKVEYTEATDMTFENPVKIGNSVTLNSGNNWSNTWSNFDLSDDNGNPYYYYVEEVGTHSGYTVSYMNNGGIQSGEIVITNRMEEKPIVLPETGGTGTYWYTMGGVLLIAGAAFLIYKKHMQKGGRRIW